MNIKEIIEAWKIAHNPTEVQEKLAELRGNICNECPSKKTTLGVTYCDDCGCVISKKIFTNSFNPCPLSKWEVVDKPFFPKNKDFKTLI